MFQRKLCVRLFSWIALVAVLASTTTTARAADWESLFNGKDMSGWKGVEGLWRVEDGAITGETTKEKPTKGNTFLIWQGGEIGNFELKLQYRIHGGNSGIQYRSFDTKPGSFVVGWPTHRYACSRTRARFSYPPDANAFRISPP